MTATKHFGFLTLACLLAIVILAGCKSGGGTEFNPMAIPPSITALNKNAADIGEEVVISGLRFGIIQKESKVSLNGMDFEVADGNWGENQVTVSVEQGMTSGIVVVTVDNVSSQSGQEAQLFIPTAPTGDPLISAISPDFGTEGVDEIMVTGFNFGDGSGNSGVYFPAQAGAVSQTSGVILAPVGSVDINGEAVPQWSNSSIKVMVPDNAESGSVYVLVDGVQSNLVPFTVLPRALDGPPMIYTQENTPPGIAPDTGGANTPVTVSGANFGSNQGSSTITLSGAMMSVIAWTSGEIVALVPDNAPSGPIRVTVAGLFAESADFQVADQPYISGLIPSVLRVGQSLRITGINFGELQGDGSLRVGSTTITPDTWADKQITVDVLPAISFSDAQNVPVKVTTNADKSHTAYGTIESPLTVYVLTPIPDQGEAGTTEFNIFVTVVGGSGNYQYTFVPDKRFPGEAKPPIGTLPMRHIYPESKVPVPNVFETQIKVKDTDTGDEIIVDGPPLSVVPQGQAVILSIELLDFNYVAADAPRNDWVYTRVPPTFDEIAYNDFTFFGGDVYFGSALGELEDGGNPITGFPRDLGAFMSGSPAPRPYGYRYGGSQGSIVRLTGLNLGTSGDLYLNSSSLEVDDLGYQVQPEDLVPGAWSPEIIDFYLPVDIFQNLSGRVALFTQDSSVLSSTNLICSALIRDIQPPGAIDMAGQFSVSGYDLEPPVVQDVTGPSTYFIFVVKADYQDPFTGSPESEPALLANPLPADPSGPQVLFDMSTIPAQGPVEVLNGTFDQAAFVQGTMVAGDWQGFLWTGVISNGPEFVRALSGIFSETFYFETSGGGGGGGDTWSISGMILDDGFPNEPLSNINVLIENITGPAYNNMVQSGIDGSFIFTNVPGDQQYQIWCEDPAWFWPGPRPVPNSGVLTADEVDVWISANGPT